MLLYELSCLNQVELELCNISRVGGQIFTLYAGSHTSIKIKGHHTLYFNKPEFTSKLFNYYKQHNDHQQESTNGGNNNDASSATNIDNDKDNYNNCNSSPALNIKVVLTGGAFTIEQQDNARSKTTVCEVLYRYFYFDEQHICQPRIIDLSNTVESQDSNIDKGYSTKVVFVDHNELTDYNGSYGTSQQFTTDTFANILGDSNTLQARSSSNTLRNYEDQNLYKSYPIYFLIVLAPKLSVMPSFTSIY